ncbi:MAG: hypothetical protein ACR2PR_03865 [Pseudohongiellaceae bacterium]
MTKKLLFTSIALAAVLAMFTTLHSQEDAMSFFITSEGSGDGANLGGLAGADAHCQALAEAVGSSKTWRAYLSAHAEGGSGAQNARDRIGSGPWYNARGVMVAADVGHLHTEDMFLGKENSLNEKGEQVNGRGDSPNQHDILTGSSLDGRVIDDGADHTCGNWTSNSSDGTAQVGHHDRQGGGPNPNSWNSAHGSRGCSQANLVATGGNGYYYCFATD